MDLLPLPRFSARSPRPKNSMAATLPGESLAPLRLVDAVRRTLGEPDRAFSVAEMEALRQTALSVVARAGAVDADASGWPFVRTVAQERTTAMLFALWLSSAALPPPASQEPIYDDA